MFEALVGLRRETVCHRGLQSDSASQRHAEAERGSGRDRARKRGTPRQSEAERGKAVAERHAEIERNAKTITCINCDMQFHVILYELFDRDLKAFL